MLHYLLYKALSDERTRDAVAAARRHELVAAAAHDSSDTTTGWASRLNHATRRKVALLNGLRGTSSTVTATRGGGSTMTSGSGAGPIGCAT